jgi:hypothetical protein
VNAYSLDWDLYKNQECDIIFEGVTHRVYSLGIYGVDNGPESPRHVLLYKNDIGLIEGFDMIAVDSIKTVRDAKIEMAEFYTDVLSRVVKGAKWLNKHEPGWQQKVDIDEFDITDEAYCIIGSVLGDYDQIWDGKYDKSEKWAYEHGFDISGEISSSRERDALEYSILQETWVDYLRMVQ